MSLVDLGKRLLEAAKKGDTDAVRALMSNGAPFTTDWLGTSPLHFATQCGHQHTVEVLLRAGISRDARTKVDRTPLHVAAQEGHVGIVELLLQNAADIDAKDMLKMTPLHWATEKGHIPIIEVLLRHGADVNCENKFDRTPLDIAIANGRLDLAQMLRNGQSANLLPLSNSDEIITIETSEATEIVSTSEQLEDQVNGTVEPDQCSTSVLATLAALAEASGPINSQSVSNAETMNWLESHGITMITATDGSIITSAVDSGQTITLTEAGKMALDIIQQQELVEGADGTVAVTTEDSLDPSNVTHIQAEDGDQQEIITIVTNPDTEEDEETSDAPGLTVIEGDTLQEGDTLHDISTLSTTGEVIESLEPPIKKIKTEVEEHIAEFTTDEILQQPPEEEEEGQLILEQTEQEEVTVAVVEADEVTTTNPQDELKKQLEAVQKQAKAFEEKLRKKEEEAEIYKKQLSEHIKTE